jgi:hypothetical protein
VVEGSFRFCPWCASPLRSKQAAFFMGAGADANRALRVSRFEGEREVRVSLWDDSGRAEAALSLDDEVAARLAAFVAAGDDILGDDEPTLSLY